MLKKYKKEAIILVCIYALSIIFGALYLFNLRTLNIKNIAGSVYTVTSLYDFIAYILIADIFATGIVILLSGFGKTDALLTYFVNLFERVRQNRIRLLIWLLTAAALILLSYIAELLISGITISYFIWQRFAFISACFLTALLIYTFRGRPEKTFLCISLTIGTLFAVTLPISTVSWDDDIHYPWALEHTSIYRFYLTGADEDIRTVPIDDYFNKTSRETHLRRLNSNGREFSRFLVKDYSYLYTGVAHIPPGIGVFLGRSLGLSWVAAFILGRIFNLIAYSSVVYFAIKRLKYGKYVISVIALIPTALFVASNYSYDAWVIAWLMLGTAYLLAELQDPGSKVKPKNLVIMLTAFILGVAPKAVYFPFMFLLCFIGKDKFESPKHSRIYKIVLTVSILLVFASFALPFLANPGDYNDNRGGSVVSSGGQTSWILSNPLKYTGIVFGFMKNYLDPANSAEYLTNFAFLDYTRHYFIYMLIFITAVVFTDENKKTGLVHAGLKTTVLLSTLASLTLIITALYISFTPVGNETILGVSPRYILPCICPVLLIVRSGRIKTKINKNLYSCTIFTLSAYFLLSSFWLLCISNYN